MVNFPHNTVEKLKKKSLVFFLKPCKKTYYTEIVIFHSLNSSKMPQIYIFLIFSEGYYSKDYKFRMVPSKINNSIYKVTPNVDMEGVGGPWSTIAELRGNTLIINFRKISSNINVSQANIVNRHLSNKNIDLIGIRKIDPRKPNVMIYELKDVKSGTVFVQHYDKQL